MNLNLSFLKEIIFYQDEDAIRQAELEACERRKLELQAAADFHLTIDETELERENNIRSYNFSQT